MYVFPLTHQSVIYWNYEKWLLSINASGFLLLCTERKKRSPPGSIQTRSPQIQRARWAMTVSYNHELHQSVPRLPPSSNPKLDLVGCDPRPPVTNGQRSMGSHNPPVSNSFSQSAQTRTSKTSHYTSQTMTSYSTVHTKLTMVLHYSHSLLI